MRFQMSRMQGVGIACALICIELSGPQLVAHAAPVPISAPYAQNFDALANMGTSVPWADDVTLPGWYSSRTAYIPSIGSSNTGALYSFGVLNAADRALGSVASAGTGTLSYGVRLSNDTANTITSVSVQYTGEQWREGGAGGNNQKLDFAYKVTTASLSGGVFTDVDALDFTNPHVGVSSASALDGNLAANRTVITGTISGLFIAPGQVLWLQWSDINDVGNDNGYSVDDLAVMIASTSGGGGTGDPCTEADTAIGAVQGSGASAAITGVVTVQGIVVGDYEGPSPQLRGFYVQDNADSDPATSNAIFVFNGDADSVDLGDEVQVTGMAAEFQGQTQLSAVSGIELCGADRTLPATEVELPVPSPDYFERYEGMLVRFAQPLYVTELFQLGRFGQVTVAAEGRLPQPTNVAQPGAAALAVQADNLLNAIIVDDALQSQNPDPILFGRGGAPLSASNTLRGGDSVTGLTGIATYTWAGNAASGNAYRIRPVGALGASLPNFVSTNTRPVAAPAVGGTLKVASFNLLNFFNTFGTTACSFGVGGATAECRGAENSEEFARQVAKTVAAIQLLDADVLGVMEMENDGYGPTSAIAVLVDRVNAVLGAGTYAFVDFDALVGRSNAGGTDAIKVGMLYKQSVVTPVPNATFADAAPVHNRAPLAQTFEAANHGRITIIANHFKSKSCSDAAGANADQGDGQGCYNAQRVSQAQALASFIGTVQNASGDPDVLLVGDFNAYAKEDPISVLAQAGFDNLVLRYGGADAYSYAFDGQWGYLDQALVTSSTLSQVTGAADFHINADEPSVLDYNTNFKTPAQVSGLYAADAYRTSDHDPVLVGLSLTPVAVTAAPASNLPLRMSIAALLGTGMVVAGVRRKRRA